MISPNFSVGVNVFWKACEVLAKALDGYEVEIIEVHHDKKKDAPSGTAMKAADIISQATDVDKYVYGRQGAVGARGKEIGIHAVRAGDVVGEHTVIFAGNRERIELTHRAHSREAFAEGCITAIRWVNGRKDGEVHTMAEVLGHMIKVMKFGGTSVGSGEAMDRTSDIIKNEPAKKAVVVSAMSGVTNDIIASMNDSETDPRRLGRKASDEAHAGGHRENGPGEHGGVPVQAGRPSGEAA